MADAAVHSTDLIIGRSLITAETIAQELRERLARDIAGKWGLLSQSQLLERAREILYEFEPMVAQHLMATDLAAWVAGMESVASEIPSWAADAIAGTSGVPPSTPQLTIPGLFDSDEPQLRFPMLERAAERLQQRNIMTRGDFDNATEGARVRAFTIAGDMTEESIGTVRDLLAEDIDEGTSLRSFSRLLEERLEPGVISPSHLENVYRTNVQAAFRDGYEDLISLPIVNEVFPYQAYLAIGDSRVRPNHLALENLGLNGTNIYRRDDPMWDYFTPPWSWQCRCGTNPMTVEAASRHGVKEAQRWHKSGQPPERPEWRLDAIKFRPEDGFVSGRRVVRAA